MSKKRNVIVSIFLAFFVFSGEALSSDSYFYGFEVFTNNGDWGTGGANFGDPGLDLSVEVYNGFETAHFKFHNNSAPSVGASITDIYFDDGILLGISSITNQPTATSFDSPAKPSELPGNTLLEPDFITSNPGNQSFSADSDPPTFHNGIEAGEWLIISYALQPGGTIDDVIQQLNSSQLRIGIHAQGFADGSSESAVNVPEPSTVLLLGIGSLVLFIKPGKK